MRWTLVVTVLVAAIAILAGLYGRGIFERSCGFENSEDFLISSSRIVTPDGVLAATLHVKDGKIQGLYRSADVDQQSFASNIKRIDYDTAVISPGLIDVHVHFNEPGDDTREGIRTGTRAGVVGGITMMVDMPTQTRPPSNSCQRLKSKIFRFKIESFGNIGAWAGVNPDNVRDVSVLQCMIETCGAFGFFSALNSEAGYLPSVNLTHISQAMTLAKQWGIPYAVQIADKTSIKDIDAVIQLLEESTETVPFKEGFRVHFTRVINVEALLHIQEAKEKGLPVSMELSPHYLHFSDREANGNPLLKTQPAIPKDEVQKHLLSLLRQDHVDIIASDHSPAMPKEKSVSFEDALTGVSGLQYMLPVIWTVLSQGSTTNADLIRLSQMMSQGPADLIKLKTKGHLSPGMDADFVVWNPDEATDTSQKGCRMRHPMNSPYLNAKLKGKVIATWLAGNRIFDINRGLSWSSCRRIYGLGEWAKIVVMGFYERSFVE